MSTPTMVNLVPSTTPTLTNEENPEKVQDTSGGMPVVDPIPDGTGTQKKTN